MQWNLGLQGVATLVAMSLVFGVFAQVVFWRKAGLWFGPVAAAVAFVVGVLVSEVLFGWATVDDLQPNIDGLSFDETLIGLLLLGVAVLVLRYLARDTHAGAAV